MSGRMTLGSLFVLSALIPGLCQAQGGYGSGAGAPPGAWQAQGPSPALAQDSGYTVPPQGNFNTIYEQLPDDLGFLHDDSPLEMGLKNLFRHSYFRGEYLLWTAGSPGNVLLGGQPAGGFIPTVQSSAAGGLAPPIPPNSFNVAGGNPLTQNPATAVVPSLDAFALKNINGYRGTFGLPIGPGNAELSAFVLGTRTNQFDGSSMITPEITANLLAVPPILTTTPATFIGEPVTVAGVQTQMLFTNSYLAVMKTSIWGSEANYIFDAPNEGTGDLVTISPLFGFRYLNYRESLSQGGVYQFVTDNTTNPVTTSPEIRALYSQSNNNYYGPQIGTRVEMKISKVTFGAEPKIMLGLNTYTAALSTINVPFDNPANNVNQSFFKSKSVFAPVADVKFSTRINISQYANVYAAYNLMWVGSLSRPYDTIGYNISAGGAGLFNPKFSDSIIQGLSVGGELAF